MPSRRKPTEADRAVAFGARVRQLRRQRGLTQAQVARRLPMSGANLSRIELGAQGPPSEDLVLAIAKALDTDPSPLLRAAGRTYSRTTFEERVLSQLETLTAQIRDGLSDLAARLDRVEAALTSAPNKRH
jgi:transcriptional regulator with XRE-family HTH domain